MTRRAMATAFLLVCSAAAGHVGWRTGDLRTAQFVMAPAIIALFFAARRWNA